jgi:ankyrin repeat protein
MEGKLNTVLVLLEKGAEVNLYAGGVTPLHLATGFGAFVNEKEEGESFQELVKRLGIPESNFLEITKALVEAGADIHAQSYFPDSGKKSFFDFLREKIESRTPFDYAKEIGSEKVANYLKAVAERERRK